MALVTYSDSESEDESIQASPAPESTITAKPTAQKLVNRREPSKIRVNLPSVQPEPGQDESNEPASKRAKTSGAFSGFNSLLPPPKRKAESGLRRGISLKTSSEAAFSRNPLPMAENDDYEVESSQPVASEEDRAGRGQSSNDAAAVEPTIVGKPTKFLPLSVANKGKRRALKPKSMPLDRDLAPNRAIYPTRSAQETIPTKEANPPPKPKASLFSLDQAEEAPSALAGNNYAPELMSVDFSLQPIQSPQQTAPHAPSPDLGTLEAAASDLNLTPAQRRQLFGRHASQHNAQIAHFNMDAEYRANQELAASGEQLEHRAVKTVAPGKHSLQQLVNNVRGQQDALEDKWAAGRATRGEGSSRYGWAK